MAKRTWELLVAGITWPPETFLARLIHGLADTGVVVTIASHRKPGREWLSHPNLRWLYTPAWEGPITNRLLRLGWMRARSMLRAAKDIASFEAHLQQAPNRIERLHRWYR